MRWAELFADLEGQFEAAEEAGVRGEVADRTRRELARIRITDRLRAGIGRPVAVTLPGAGTLRGTLADCGPDWLLLEGDPAGDALVPLYPVLGLTGLDPRAAGEPGSEGEVAARRRLGAALRAVARDRATVTCTLVDGSTLTGTVRRAGADHFEIAEQAPGERSRPDAGLRLVPYGALAVLRRR